MEWILSFFRYLVVLTLNPWITADTQRLSILGHLAVVLWVIKTGAKE